VAEPYATPTRPCDFNCGPALLCAGPLCGFDMHAQHHFLRGEAAPATVRIKHLGAARAIYVAVNDQGDLRFSDKRYALSSRIVDDPDANEPNDARDAGTPLAAAVDGAGVVRYSGGGQISAWDYIDGRTTAEHRADLDSFALTLPPRAFGPPDGGCDLDAGYDGGFDPDGGCPEVPLPRPAYGMALHWRGPSDGVYRLGLQGTLITPDGGFACRFSFDERFAHPEGADGGYAFGNDPADPCFCLPAANAEKDQLWLRVEAAHRPQPPEPNASSDRPYSFTLVLTPGTLQPLCGDGGCPALMQPSACPGN